MDTGKDQPGKEGRWGRRAGGWTRRYETARYAGQLGCVSWNIAGRGEGSRGMNGRSNWVIKRWVVLMSCLDCPSKVMGQDVTSPGFPHPSGSIVGGERLGSADRLPYGLLPLGDPVNQAIRVPLFFLPLHIFLAPTLC